ncbi:MAG: glycosyltransferase family 4 protein, partial [Elusimicrobiota bacterium]
MRIGLLHGWLLDGSGSNIYVRQLARALTGRGHKVHVFCQEPNPSRFEGIGTIHVPPIDKAFMPVYVADTSYPGFEAVVPFTELVDDPRLERYLNQWAKAVAGIVRDHDLEVLHANHVYPMPEVARRVKEGGCGTPYLVFPHGSAIEYTTKKSPALKEAAARAIDSADALVVGNDVVTQRIFRLHPDRAADWRKKHEIVSVGVDSTLFEPVSRTGRRGNVNRLIKECASPELEKSLGAVDWDNDKIVLYVGKLISAKGVQDLVAAMPQVLERVPNARLIIVGEGPLEKELKEASEKHTPGRVLFTGYLSHDKLRYLLPCADLAAFPSLVAEAYPLVLLEAISAGVLPCASYFEGLADGLDSIGARLNPELAKLMRLPAGKEGRAEAIAFSLSGLLSREPDWKDSIRN